MRSKRSIRIFYLLVIYVLLQFSWWAYLLIKTNNEVFYLKMYPVQPPTEEQFVEYQHKCKQKFYMVFGEGIVFLSLLSLGIYRLNKIRKEEQALSQRQTNFLLSITHEFKSPLSSIILQLQTVLKHDLEKSKQHQLIHNAIDDSERLNNLVEKALLASRMESSAFEFNNHNFDIRKSITALEQRYSKYPNIEFRGIPKAIVTIDPMILDILISNIIDNALKYAGKEKPIYVYSSVNGKLLKLRIEDQGPGIPEVEKKKIFEKFYRVGSEETRKTKGTGLGLYIANLITIHYKGKITAKNVNPHGIVFEIELPIAHLTE